MQGLAHLRRNRKEGGGSGIREHDSGDSSDSCSEVWTIDDFIVGLPDCILWCARWTILDSDSDGDDQD